ncbi:MAG: hypothetical protein WDO73_16300 [Ignavibacteriota bacterium]
MSRGTLWPADILWLSNCLLGDLHHAMEDSEQADDMDRILARFGEVQKKSTSI